jgi:glycosyltransferase involved in cell wall biosynthesis
MPASAPSVAEAPVAPPREPLIILTPVYNDWEVLKLLLDRLDAELAAGGESASVVVVNDGSQLPAQLAGLSLSAIRTVEVLHLRRNLGHQRAIAVGLAYVEANLPCSAVVVMDADGEDQPRDVLRLVEQWRRENSDKVVFALRTRRSEGPVFRVFYALYRWVFQGLTGQAIRVGNFSLIPRSLLRRLVAVSEIWNHYASGVQRAKVPCLYLPTERGKRLAGHSTMNFVSLVTHGMSAISVHAETIGTRMMVLAMLLGFGIVLAMGAVVSVRFLTNLAIPGWATYVFGLLSLMLMQIFFIALFFAGTVLHGRNAYTFLPSRDHPHFVDLLERIDVTRPG